MNSKKKGNRGERQAVQFMKNWVGKDFARTPQSGGLHWKTKNTTGDIVCLEEGFLFPFSIEVKFPKEIDLVQEMYPIKKKVDDYWGQCIDDAREHNKVPMLMVRRNGMPAGTFLIFLPISFIKYIYNTLGPLPKPYFRVAGKYVIMNTETLITYKYSTIHKIALRWRKDQQNG